jgi:hypothetical protein
MARIDLKVTYRAHYRAKVGRPVVVEVPPRPYLMIDGAGDPNTSSDYVDAVQALYPLAYGLRAAIKAATGDAYTVMPLEGLWWVPDMATFSIDAKDRWLWTAMISLPDEVSADMVAEVLPAVTETKQLAAGGRARVERFGDGRAAQVLHVGPYATEAPTIASVHSFIADQGGALTGKHHEIYLSNPKQTEPAKLRTIIRQPMT